MLTFMMNDRKGDFFEITDIIPKLLGHWNDPKKTELDAIKALMADSGCTRFCQGETFEECVPQILRR